MPVAALVVVALSGCWSSDADPAPAPTPPTAGLEAIGYVAWDKTDDERAGVVRREVGAEPGVNVYCSEADGVVVFMDMAGEVLRRVALGGAGCKVAVPASDGTLWVLVDHTAYQVDGSGAVVTVHDGNYHHDVAADDTGGLHLLTYEEAAVDARFHAERPMVDNHIVVLGPDGERRRVSLADVVAQVPELLERARRHLTDPTLGTTRGRKMPGSLAADPFHANSIDVLEDPGETGWPAGAWLITARHLDAAFVVDPATERIVWHWGLGVLQWPHHPTLLPSGRLLVFDNGVGRRKSRVLEVDVASRKPVWRYPKPKGEPLYTRTRGSAQRLAGGNTLITESDSGRAVEVTPDGEVVWEFLNPLRRDGERATIFRVTRWTTEAYEAFWRD